MNGRLDLSTLVRVEGWAYLAPATAAAWNAVRDEMYYVHGLAMPRILPPDGGYRTFERQQYWRTWWSLRGKPWNAAWPGHSNHGWGTALDIDNYWQNRAVLEQVLARYGFRFNVPTEPWHVQHDSTWPASVPPTAYIPIEEPEEDPMSIYIRPTGNSTPVPSTGTSRIWAGDNRMFSGVAHSGVWELTHPGARRLTMAEWKAIEAAYEKAGRKLPIAEVTGNEAEIIVYAGEVA